jgi:hypothetical protein
MAGGSIVNLSESGLRIESPESFPVNSVIQLFVQFRHHAVRLKARVAWSGGSEGGTTAMGLTFTQPEPALAKAYKEWLAEVKQMSREAPETAGGGTPTAPADAAGGAGAAAAADAAPETAAATPRSAATPAPEPRSPVRRRLESPQGRIYDAVLEKQAGGWSVAAVQVPRVLGTGRNDLEGHFPTYADAEKALRDFVRSR